MSHWQDRLLDVVEERLRFYKQVQSQLSITNFVIQILVDDFAALMVMESLRARPDAGMLVTGTGRTSDSHIATIMGAEVHRVPQMFPSIESTQARMRFGIIEDMS